jgi:hypothetical protein
MGSARITGCSNSASGDADLARLLQPSSLRSHRDYPRLLLTRWDQGAGKVPELEVYGPPGMQMITQRLFADDGAFGLDLISRTQNRASIDVYRARGGEGERGATATGRPRARARRIVRRDNWACRSVEVNHFRRT